jgi:hypothetical protein
VEEGHTFMGTVNKQAGQRRQEWQGKLRTAAVMRKAPLERGKATSPCKL